MDGLVVTTAELAELYAEQEPTAAPAYQRVKDLVAGQIVGGSWREGQALPSESQFVESLGLSRMTVNRALRELSAEGLLRRVMGVGTFVERRKSSSALVEVHNIADEIQGRGHRHSARVVSLREELPAPEIAAQLGLDGRRCAFRSRVVHLEDGAPVQLEDRFVHPDFAPGYLQQDFTARTPYTFLSQVAPLGRGEHIVEAVLPSAEECEILGVGPGEPCLLIQRRTWSQGAVVSVARLIHPGSRYRLEGTFDAH
ncbi:histidine utilization repressor [Streptomyces sp. B-S-A8]|uniref:Histidine utilization repressor n=1 Tax=Streptomyces solicavernae TaxID=3043614 RepID=A0ABT6RVV2_9ACTN|nr:histidine utilization repressor [Streptomyces sp. B-S-A8]MDI3387878.1 histidine utilization repressor [Streptomyces sp. B-S-A8]